MYHWRRKPESSVHSASLFGPAVHEERVDGITDIFPRLSDL